MKTTYQTTSEELIKHAENNKFDERTEHLLLAAAYDIHFLNRDLKAAIKLLRRYDELYPDEFTIPRAKDSGDM